MLKISFFLSVLAIVVSLFSPALVLAGGGLVSYDVAVSNGGENFNVSPGTQFVVRPYVHLNDNSPCSSCLIKVKLENPQGSDYIAQSSDYTDQDGTMYAKVISYGQGVRYAYVEVTLPSGEVYTGSKTSLNYAPTYIYAQEPNPTLNPTSTPYPVITPNPTVSVTPKATAKPTPKISPNPTVLQTATPIASVSATPSTQVAVSISTEPKDNYFVATFKQVVKFLTSIF